MLDIRFLFCALGFSERTANSAKLKRLSVLNFFMLKALRLLLSLQNLNLIKSALEKDQIPLNLLEGSSLECSFRLMPGGGALLIANKFGTEEPVLEFRLFDTGFILVKVLLESLVVPLDEPINHDLEIAFHQKLSSKLRSGELSSVRLQSGTLAAHYLTSVSGWDFSVQKLNNLLYQIKEDQMQPAYIQVCEMYQQECERHLANNVVYVDGDADIQDEPD